MAEQYRERGLPEAHRLGNGRADRAAGACAVGRAVRLELKAERAAAVKRAAEAQRVMAAVQLA
eukprot:3491478-Lingulodinium_polyedra.AAC.1